MKKRFSCKSARVKGLSFHPSRPWIITSLHTGLIQIWDYNMDIVIAKFEDHQGPVRSVCFHNSLPLFCSGGDDGFVKVFNYKQKRCLFTLKGHIDYVRTVFFHHQLPWILSASDDQTMRIWNYQSRQCVNIITGHSHYVMCAQFHPQKNFIVSGSLDCTVRIWDFTVLKKKLTESKNLSGFVGIQIECIKILEGHERGVDWVCFHPTQNMIASCSDDKKIKLWKYTSQVAWQHSTIAGHTHNVSNVIFDPKTGNLISNGQDCTTRVWNPQTKNHIVGHKRVRQRYWILAVKKNGSLVASGHDNGLDIFYLNKQKIPHCVLQKNLVIFAQGMKTFLYDPQKKIQKQQLYQFNPKDPESAFFIQRITVNPFCSTHFMVQINEQGARSFVLKKKENYLNFPYVMRNYEAKDSCFVSKTRVASLQSPQQIHFFNYVDKEDRNKGVLKLKEDMQILRIFSSDQEDVLVFVTNQYIAKYHIQQNKIIAQQAIEPETDVRRVQFWKEKIAILGKFQVIITDLQLNRITTIQEKFPVQSAFWESQQILFYTTNNHWKYTMMNGQTGILKTIEEPLHLLSKISDNKFLAFSETNKIFEMEHKGMQQIEFKLAISDKKWDKVKQILQQMGKNNRTLLAYLVQKGYAHIALDSVENPEQKFALAIQSTNFQMAFQICNKINTQEYWKMLGDQALKQGIYQAYEVSCQKQKNYDKVNFLYSLQGNTEKMQKLIKLSKKLQNPMLAFNTALFLNNTEEKQNILRDLGLQKLAALSVEAESDPSQQCQFLRKLQPRPLQPVQIQNQQDFSNWPHSVAEDDEDQES